MESRPGRRDQLGHKIQIGAISLLGPEFQRVASQELSESANSVEILWPETPEIGQFQVELESRFGHGRRRSMT